MSNGTKRLRCALTGNMLEVNEDNLRLSFRGKQYYVRETVLLGRIGIKQNGKKTMLKLPGVLVPIRHRTPEENAVNVCVELVLDDLVKGDARVGRVVAEISNSVSSLIRHYVRQDEDVRQFT